MAQSLLSLILALRVLQLTLINSCRCVPVRMYPLSGAFSGIFSKTVGKTRNTFANGFTAWMISALKLRSGHRKKPNASPVSLKRNLSKPRKPWLKIAPVRLSGAWVAHSIRSVTTTHVPTVSCSLHWVISASPVAVQISSAVTTMCKALPTLAYCHTHCRVTTVCQPVRGNIGQMSGA